MTHTHRVLGTFTYRRERNDKTFTVVREWPCKNEEDARLIVQRHGMKTGALHAECVMEELSNAQAK